MDTFHFRFSGYITKKFIHHFSPTTNHPIFLSIYKPPNFIIECYTIVLFCEFSRPKQPPYAIICTIDFLKTNMSLHMWIIKTSTYLIMHICPKTKSSPHYAYLLFPKTKSHYAFVSSQYQPYSPPPKWKEPFWIITNYKSISFGEASLPKTFHVNLFIVVPHLLLCWSNTTNSPFALPFDFYVKIF
jgi:hypothetical protein